MNIQYLTTRKKLNEGRNYGVGFSIYKKTKKNNYNAVIPFTACRDFLNDIAYVENTKQDLAQIYGFKYTNNNILKNTRKLYVGVNILHYNSGTSWNDYDKAIKLLINNHKILEYNLNQIEKKLKLKTLTKIIIKDNNLFISTSKYWLKNSALISVYTLFIRLLFHIDIKYSTDELINLLISDNFKTFIFNDEYFKQYLVIFLKNIRYNYTKNYQYGNSSYAIHNDGIISYIDKHNLKKVNHYV